MSIKTIDSPSKHIIVSTPPPPYVLNTAMGQSVGMMRYNTSSSSIEVYDGHSWININTHSTVSMTPDAEAALTWAINYRKRMAALEDLALSNPTIANALENLHKAEEQLHIVEILCKEDEK